MIHRVRKKMDQGGFTLIELLIVIIVLGILVAIVLFSLGTFKSDSAAAACKADAKQVKTAETAYYLKHNAYTADLSVLVSQSFLQTVPSTDNYTIAVDDTDGTVSGCP